jgi:hypothetical protein
MKAKLLLALKSRTVWTIVVLFIINGVTGIQDSIPANIMDILNPILGLLAIYFRINPKV